MIDQASSLRAIVQDAVKEKTRQHRKNRNIDHHKEQESRLHFIKAINIDRFLKGGDERLARHHRKPKPELINLKTIFLVHRDFISTVWCYQNRLPSVISNELLRGLEKFSFQEIEVQTRFLEKN